MTKPVNIEAGVLEWLRKRSGRTILEFSTFLGIEVANYIHIEKSISSYDVSFVPKMAEFLGCATATILLPTAPVDNSENIDTRLLSSTDGKISPAAWNEIKYAIADREEYIEVTNDRNTPQFNSTNSGIDNLAQETRKLVGLDSMPRSDYYTRLNLLRDKLESLGFLVFQRHIDGITLHEHCSGLCITSSDAPPVILINSKDVPQRRIFTLIHELIHLSVQKITFDSFKELERFCDTATGEVLMPTEQLIGMTNLHGLNKTSGTDALMRGVTYLARNRFVVSRHAVMVRLRFLNIISSQQYDNLMVAFKLNTDSWSEIGDTGFVHPARKSVIEKGLKMNSAVIDSVASGHISIERAERILGIESKHFGAIGAIIKHRKDRKTWR